jgi:hypothetical protein
VPYPGHVRRVVPCTFSAVCLLLAAASPNAIAADGVTVDPDSPAGQEYAIPLDDARRGAGGDAGQSSGSDTQSGTRPVPAFGVGVTAPAQKKGETHRPGKGTAQPSAGHESAIGDGLGQAASLTPSTSGVSGSSLLWSGGAAALVLLVGLGAGLAARRSRQA